MSNFQSHLLICTAPPW